MKMLSPEVRREIVRLYVEEHMLQSNIASLYKVSATVVNRLVRLHAEKPEHQREYERKRERQRRARAAIKATAEEMLARSVPIQSSDIIVARVNEQTDLKVKNHEVRSVLKKDLGLGYRLAKKVPPQANSERCLVLRQQYAIRMIELLQEKKRIINVDESWINESSFLRKMWCPGYSAATTTIRSVAPRVSLIASLDTDGIVHYSLNQANTD